MEVEIIIESAIKQGFHSEMVHAALIDANPVAIRTFIGQLAVTVTYSLEREVVQHLMRVSRRVDDEKALDVLRNLYGNRRNETELWIREECYAIYSPKRPQDKSNSASQDAIWLFNLYGHRDQMRPEDDLLTEQIIGAMTKLEFDINVETLRGTLDMLDVDAIRDLLNRLSHAYKTREINEYLCEDVAAKIVNNAAEQAPEKSLPILSLFLEFPIPGSAVAPLALAKMNRQQDTIPLLRQALDSERRSVRETAARMIIRTQYKANPVMALDDKSDLVRCAATKLLEYEKPNWLKKTWWFVRRLWNR